MMMLEMTRQEITTREVGTTREMMTNYIKKTEYYDEEENELSSKEQKLGQTETKKRDPEINWKSVIKSVKLRRYDDDNEEDEAYVDDVERDDKEIEDDYKEEKGDDEEKASMTRNKRATITNNLVMMNEGKTTKLEMMSEEITTREVATTREMTTTNYIKKTEYFDEEEKGVIVEGTENRADGDKDDEEETTSN
ncbi:uncharacterized protein LOC111874442 [Cryptotermes secundus]|uniref:uncharacterized protein LOC111874442 n=1 Tax=Cryptotermes secundus TaxID=105785 RepID=UPI000CD7DB65|nr:uncharacterized protein LOC111874442 [Cryptotermes secundus]